MTPTQKALARHALGLPNSRGQSYRNRYHCQPVFPRGPFDDWERMEKAGLADRLFTRSGGLSCFILTDAGAKAALDPGELLDIEDFPASGQSPSPSSRIKVE